jgi:hypothetical protein
MRHLYLTIVCFSFLVNSVFAQSTQDTLPTQVVTAQPPVTPVQPTTTPQVVTSSQPISYSGGYGHFFTGPAWIEPTDLINHLQSPEVFGPSLKWTSTSITTGGEGFAELHRLLIGGGGFGLIVQNMEADNGTVRFAFGGGYAKVGYALLQNPRYFLSFLAGFGGGVMYVGIENNSDDTPVFFSSNEPVFPNEEQDYFRGYLLYDLAISNKMIATTIKPNSRNFGGFMLGLDLGATIGIPVDTWRDDFGTVSGIPSPGTVVSPYLRLTIGGGGFRTHAQ